MKDERLTDAQVLAIVERCEEKYGYKMFHHQRVIVEHVKDGRQHFHVIWNRVSLMTGRPVWPGEHWKKSKQICREMEVELGLKRPTPKRFKGPRKTYKGKNRSHQKGRTYKSGQYSKRQGYTKAKSYKGKPYKAAYTKSGGQKPFSGGFPKKRFSPSQKTKSIRTANFKSSDRQWSPQGRYNVLNTIRPIVFKPPPTIRPIIFKSFKEAPQQTSPQRPIRSGSGWPEAAILDWKSWGHREPGAFLRKWPELAP